ncbi:MAG: hypothetical protein AAF585_15595, partial [Verrucomicrobiota bacterium]
MFPLRSNLLILASGILFMGVSPSSFGHGSEYVYAKLSIAAEPRSVVLELGLDFLPGQRQGRLVLAMQASASFQSFAIG